MGIYDRDWYKNSYGKNNEKISKEEAERLKRMIDRSPNEPPKVDPKYKYEYVDSSKGYDPTYGCGYSSSNSYNTNATTVHATTVHAETVENENKYCYKCGKLLKGYSRFCPYCGEAQDGSKTSNYHTYNENVGFKKKRHGFVTFWLVTMLCFCVIGLFVLFSDSISPMLNLLKLFGIINDIGITYSILQVIVYIIAVVLLLNWKKIGFWLIIATDIVSSFVLANKGDAIILLLVSYAIKDVFLFGILNIRKNGISTWDYLKKNSPFD